MKFAQIDRDYSAKKRAFCAKYGRDYDAFWPIVNDWALYCGIFSLSRELIISDLLRSTLDVPGHVAEFGSWRGANLLFMAKILRIFDPHGQKQLHCFEGFEGLTTFAPEDLTATTDRGAYRGSYDELVDVIDLYDMQDEIVIHSGLVQNTLPQALEQAANLSFSFVYLDLDLYEPTKIALETLHERLSVGGLFVFDEWNFEAYPGETTAAREFLAMHGTSYRMESVRHTRQPSMLCARSRDSFAPAMATIDVAATDPRIAAAPFVWEPAGTTLSSSHGGAWLRFSLRQSRCLVLRVVERNESAHPPALEFRIGGRPWRELPLVFGRDEYVLSDDLVSADADDVEIVIGSPSFGFERWHGTTPAACVRIAGFRVDDGALLAPIAAMAKPTLLFGDSIGEGAWNLGIDITSARRSFAFTLARALDSDVGGVCFAGQGLRYRETPDAIPPLFDEDPRRCTWAWYRADKTRLTNGRFAPEPGRIAICIGTNDGFNAHVPGDVTGGIAGLLAALRAAAPYAVLHTVVPFGGFCRPEVHAGFARYRATSGDRNCAVIDLGRGAQAGLDRDRATKMHFSGRPDPAAERTSRGYDGLHPDVEAHAELGARLVAAILTAEARIADAARGQITA